jgi:hypothetical protein
MGLGVLDAVDIGGTWTVVGDGEAASATAAAGVEPPEAEPAERRQRLRPLWIGLAGAAVVLLFAMLISRGLPGQQPPGALTPPPVAAPGATDQSDGTASTPSPTSRPTHEPSGAVVPAGQPRPTGSTPAPLPSVTEAPTPPPTPTPSPTPVPTDTITPPRS